MPSAKDIVVKPIKREDANALVRRVHYSGKITNNSQLHLGVFLDGYLEGAMQFGPSLDKRKLIDLVAGTAWTGFLELNRMAFSDRLPRNSESRALGVALRLIRKQYPHIEWVVSFADATQCGDGTIYRAAGFVLTQIKKNTSIWQVGEQTFTDVGYRTGAGVVATVIKATESKKIKADGGASMRHLREAGARPLDGYQLRYVYFLNPAARERLSVPPLPYSAIDEAGARMYRGQKRETRATVATSDAAAVQLRPSRSNSPDRQP